MGCAIAGVSSEPFFVEGTVPSIPEAESLVAYYLQFPEVKSILDKHWADSDEYAANNLSLELRQIIGTSSKERMTSSSENRPDEIELAILWNLLRPIKMPVEQAMQSLAAAFLYGASIHHEEVERLWGVQVHTTVVPLMETPLDEARRQMLSNIKELSLG
jgi:hypothetical protein